MLECYFFLGKTPVYNRATHKLYLQTSYGIASGKQSFKQPMFFYLSTDNFKKKIFIAE